MHPVLDLQSDGSITENNETFEKGLRETSSSSLLVHDDRPELLVIANENRLLTTHDKGDHAF